MATNLLPTLIYLFLCPVITGGLFALLLLCITIQMVYVLYFFAPVLGLAARAKNILQHTANPQPVSVIICAKNEATNLKQHLPSIMAQRYSNAAGNSIYEVIVVDDASTDDTPEVLATFQKQYPHLKIVTVLPNENRTLPGKKYALSKAVAVAAYEHLLMTDADCHPVSDTWLQQMVAPLQRGKQVVGGYGQYQTDSGWLNAFIRWETLHTFIQYAGYAAVGMPYMAVGRNMACTKAALLKAQSTEEWGKLPSGDDDLLVRSLGKGYDMGIVMLPTATTLSATHNTWAGWLKQKQRHTSTGKYYRTSAQLLLGLYALSHACMWIAFFAALFTTEWQEAIGAIACRCTIYWWLWNQIAKQLQEKGLTKWFLIADIGWMLYNFVLSPYIFWKNKQQWT